MNVFVLDGDENQAVAAVRSLGRAGHTVRVGSPYRWPKAAMSRWCTGRFRYPNPEDAADSDFLKSLALEISTHGGGLILPMTERTTLPVSARRDELIAVGGAVVLPPHATILRAFDKSATTELASALGLAVPKTALVHEGESIELATAGLSFPLVLKPKSSFQTNAQNQTRSTGRPVYARNLAELRLAWQDIANRAGSALVQEFVPGEGSGYFALMRHGEVRAEFAHRRIRDVHPTGSGSSLRVSVLPDPQLREQSLRLLRELKWHGVAMVEFRRRPDGSLVFMEINGRFWNSLALAVYAGADFPALLAQIAEHGDIDAVPAYKEGVRCRWLLGDFRHLLAVWKGAPRGFPGQYPGRLSTLLRFLVPVPGTFHDNFMWSDPLPELGDWLDFLIHRVPRNFKRRSEPAWRNESAVRGSSRTQ